MESHILLNILWDSVYNVIFFQQYYKCSNIRSLWFHWKCYFNYVFTHVLQYVIVWQVKIYWKYLSDRAYLFKDEMTFIIAFTQLIKARSFILALLWKCCFKFLQNVRNSIKLIQIYIKCDSYIEQILALIRAILLYL